MPRTYIWGFSLLYVLIASKWADVRPNSIQREMTLEQAVKRAGAEYNVYYYPNYPSEESLKLMPKNPKTGKPRFVQAEDIDVFEWVFVDLDMKDKVYESKDAFLEQIGDFACPPTKIVDSGNGIHVYWRVSDLGAESFLRLSRRLMRYFNTDPAVCQIKQLMRVPGTVNVKHENKFKLCELLYEDEDALYTCEDLDKELPAILPEDEQYCVDHYNKNVLNVSTSNVDFKLPTKFSRLLKSNQEIKNIWLAKTDDRSEADYRLGHLLLAADFTKEEATSVLANTAKASSRSDHHRASYAQNIVDKIWQDEVEEGDSDFAILSESVDSILSRTNSEDLKGKRFYAQPHFDDTVHGYRLGQVIGLVGGAGIGKTTIALNMFKGFVERNPDYIHLFVSLEQPGREIADRWNKLSNGNIALGKKVHILSNYNEDGSYRDLSLADIQDYVKTYETKFKKKFGCVCVDHIGALNLQSKFGETMGLHKACKDMKSFAISTNTLLIMLSHTTREKASIGDIELDKDAAYGTQKFENFVDYLVTVWQPLKRCHAEKGCPKVTAYKFCKIRFKNDDDVIKEDRCYRLKFDGATEILSELDDSDTKSFDYFAQKSLNLRKKDKSSDLIQYDSLAKKEKTEDE